MLRSYGTVISSGLCILAALWVILLPIPWIAAFLTSVMLHELFHIAAIMLCGGKILQIRFRLFGAEIKTSPLSSWQEILCASAGPFSGILLLFFAKNFPRIALCGLCHSLYNLLPIYPMDGGRIIRAILFWILPQELAQRLTGLTEIVTKGALTVFIFGISLTLKSVFIPLVLAAIYLLHKLKAKISCKDEPLAVQ